MTDDEVFARVDETRRRVEARPLPESVGALIERAAAQHGDRRVCLFFEDGVELTYARLDERSNRLADALMRLGARKGTHVGVMLPNVAEFPITWIAIAKLGAVMVPINIGYTGRELSYVVNDSDAQFLVIDESCVPALDAMPDRPAILSDGTRALGILGLADQVRYAAPETLAELARGRTVSLDGQGLVRRPRVGLLEQDREFDPEVLRHVSIVKLSEDGLDWVTGNVIGVDGGEDITA